MASKRFYIGPPETGLQTDVKPFAIPEEAYAKLNNAYVFRDRTRKRIGASLLPDGNIGSQLTSRFRVDIGTTDGVTGDFDAVSGLPGGAKIIPGALPGKVGQMFSVGTTIFTVWQTGATLTTDISGSPSTADFNLATGTLAIVGNGNNLGATVYWYPSEPVMGLLTRENPVVNEEDLIGFDTQFSYQRAGGAWERLAVETLAGDALWTGTNAEFFWATNYRGAFTSDFVFFVVNNKAADGVRHFDGTTWTKFAPTISGGNTLQTARAIVPFKGRLVAFNPVIGGTRYPNRAQFSNDADPTAAATGWLQTAGAGGYTEAATREAIVSVKPLRDRIIVFFERSTWEFAWVGNNKAPFVWRKINTELGCESTFSAVPFDKVVISVGNVGVHACSGATVERIDDKIPQEVFRIHNESNGKERVYGIRDYELEMVYWAWPNKKVKNVFPNKMMVYNYANGSWAFNDDSITAFGQWQREDDLIWSANSNTWAKEDSMWNKGTLQAKSRHVIAGNQQGWTFFLDADEPRNSPAIQITNIVFATNRITAINHNLDGGEYVILENFDAGDPNVGLEGTIYQVTYISNDIVFIQGPTFVTGYLGGATMARVSQIEIWTKEFSFFSQEGFSNAIYQADFLVDRTDNGEVTVDYTPSSSNLSLITAADGTITAPITGTSILETIAYPTVTLEAEQDRFWHSVYIWGAGETLQLRLSLSDAQMKDPLIAHSDFELNAMILHAKPLQQLG